MQNISPAMKQTTVHNSRYKPQQVQRHLQAFYRKFLRIDLSEDLIDVDAVNPMLIKQVGIEGHSAITGVESR
jgi:hypothetical protein